MSYDPANFEMFKVCQGNAGADAALKMIGSNGIRVVGGLGAEPLRKSFRNTPILSQERPLAVFPILLGIRIKEGIYRKI